MTIAAKTFLQASRARLTLRFVSAMPIALVIAAMALSLPASPAFANAADSAESFTVAGISRVKRSAPARAASAAGSSSTRASAPLVTTSSTAPGNAGYVHFFIITGPDGEPETEVGIELPGDRIAWSFPGLGVAVSPFIAAGAITARGKSYDVQHIYGIRPFPDDRSMRLLQQALAQRIAPWLEQKTPFCGEEQRSNEFCVTCLGFVLRVLFPGATMRAPALPADFRGARSDLYTTEDLLMYLAGVPVDAPPTTRLKRIASLSAPESLREELERIAGDIDAAHAAKQMAAAAAAAKTRARPALSVDLPKRVLPRRRS
jgi:hypothetical protein